MPPAMTKPITEASFFFNDTATTEIYTLSLHDALPISNGLEYFNLRYGCIFQEGKKSIPNRVRYFLDRKSTRLNSSHLVMSYAVFCLKKKKGLRDRRTAMSRERVESSSP